MASEDSSRNEPKITVSGDVYDWLDEQASEGGEDAADVARRLLEAHQMLADGDRSSLADTSEETVTSSQLEERLDSLDSTVRGLLDDVRKRVIQLKRETDGKAPLDHEHDEITERLDRLDGTADRLETRLDAGFENYEEILTYLMEETESVDDRLDVLARAVLDLRREFETIATERARREGLDDLRRAANQYGIRSANCGECSSTVDIGLLTAPECPHCASGFVDLSPGTRLFKPDVLETGSPPALTESSADELTDELEEIVDEPDTERPEWNASSGGNLDD